MKTWKTLAASFLLILLLIGSAQPGSLMLEREIGDAVYRIKSTVTYSNQGTAVQYLTEEDRTVGLFMNNSWQVVNLTHHSHPLERTVLDEDGNPTGIIQLPAELSPSEQVSYSVTYQAHARPRSLPQLVEEQSGSFTDIPESLRSEYCKPGDMWETRDAAIRELAFMLAENETNVLTVVVGLVDWIWENIAYKSYEGPLYPHETLQSRDGDCDDQAILLITFCRILEIPAYLQVGCLYLPSRNENETGWNGHITYVERGIGWHGWALVYIPPWGWLPVDLTYPTGGFSKPLNAIQTAVVADIKTVQYVNISNIDYVASFWSFQKSVTENDFHVLVEDEMTRIPQEWSLQDLIMRWALRIPVIAIIATGGIIVILAYTRWSNRTRTER